MEIRRTQPGRSSRPQPEALASARDGCQVTIVLCNTLNTLSPNVPACSLATRSDMPYPLAIDPVPFHRNHRCLTKR